MKYDLKFGEAKIIADECGISVTTFNKALKGEIDTPIAKLIRSHTNTVIAQRLERVKALKSQLKKMKENK
jgi:hypothetical protein